METRIQTQEFKIPNGTNGTITLDGMKLDSGFECIGVQLVELSNPTPDDYQIKLEHGSAKVVDLQPKNGLVSSTGVAPNERYMQIGFTTTTTPIEVTIKTRAATSADVIFMLQFKLVRQ